MAKERQETEPEETETFSQSMYDWLQALVVALVCIIMVFVFIGRFIYVDGESMLDTLHDRDMMIIQEIGYTPAQGDVVVLTKPFRDVAGPIVKRVIATEGQTVDIDYEAGTVSVDGVALEEPYIREPMRTPSYENISHVTVPEGSIFVMGDNRNNSADSRYVQLGVVDERCVIGRAVAVVFPFSDFKAIK